MRFVLVHGGFHGSWCWDHLVPELVKRGHEAATVDLPGHASRQDEPGTLAAWAEAIAAELCGGEVVVGHSMAGFAITVAANAVPEKIGHLIYLAAAVPEEGKRFLDTWFDGAGDGVAETIARGSELPLAPNAEGKLVCTDFAQTQRVFYHDCDEATARWAFDRLTPMGTDFHSEVVSVPRFWQADLPRTYIRGLQDRVRPASAFERNAARLGVAAATIDSSHSPFLSRPAELAELLVHAARR